VIHDFETHVPYNYTIFGWIFCLMDGSSALTFWYGSSELLWYYFGMDPTSDHWVVVQEGQVGAEQGSVSGGFSPGHTVSSTCDKGRTTHLKRKMLENHTLVF
jgi:hypothetical protein